MSSGVPTPCGKAMAMHERRPSFFISRGNGVFTPLIPADELPIDMVVVGVSRTMSFSQTAGMTSVGEVAPSGLRYRVKLVKDAGQDFGARQFFRSPSSHTRPALPYAPDIAPTVFTVDDEEISLPAQRSSTTSNSPAPDRAISNPLTPATKKLSQAITLADRLHNQQSDSSTQRSTANGPSLGAIDLDTDVPGRQPLNAQAVANGIKSATQATRPIPCTPPGGRAIQQRANRGWVNGPLRDGSKMFCSYWLRHGECDYTQQGCKYLHEMPQDRVLLAKIGLRDFPRWWKELNTPDTLAWRQQRAPGSGDGASRTATPRSPTIHRANLDSPVRLNNSEERTAASSISRGEAVVTPPRFRAPLGRQRAPHVRASVAEHRPSSPPSVVSDSSIDFIPETTFCGLAVTTPDSRAPKIQRLISLESCLEGGVSVSQGTTENESFNLIAL